VRKITTNKFDGVAKENGVGGNDTGHNDSIKIYTLNHTLASLPVGTLVRDMNSTFLGKPVIWKIADKNHTGYPDNSVTLITEKCIALRAFDAIEPNNSNSDRKSKGNDKYSVSNIRQWLNSEGAANEWFTPQHEYDEAGYNNNEDAYADDPGFLTGFSTEIKQYFATVRNKTILCNVDRLALSKDFEETEDKVFLPSSTEMGCRDLDSNNPEGSHLDQKFIDDRSRVKNGSYGSYWLRTPNSDVAGSVCYIGYSSLSLIGTACAGEYGVAPLIVLR
jgi:hypothetical protein